MSMTRHSQPPLRQSRILKQPTNQANTEIPDHITHWRKTSSSIFPSDRYSSLGLPVVTMCVSILPCPCSSQRTQDARPNVVETSKPSKIANDNDAKCRMQFQFVRNVQTPPFPRRCKKSRNVMMHPV
jgi:hypothetical protein